MKSVQIDHHQLSDSSSEVGMLKPMMAWAEIYKPMAGIQFVKPSKNIVGSDLCIFSLLFVMEHIEFFRSYCINENLIKVVFLLDVRY